MSEQEGRSPMSSHGGDFASTETADPRSPMSFAPPFGDATPTAPADHPPVGASFLVPRGACGPAGMPRAVEAPGPMRPPPLEPTMNISGSAGEAKLYGALMDQELIHDADSKKMAMSRRRRRLNCAPMFYALLGPWFTFLATFCSSAFAIHFNAPVGSTVFKVLVLGLCLSKLQSAWRSWKMSPHDGFYVLYLCITVAAAALLGWVLGDFVFWSYMEPSYAVSKMVTYTEVDPSSMHLPDGRVVPTRGGRFSDAGTVYFTHDAELDLSRAYSFKLADLYCVAPIKSERCGEDCGHDFWAVGKNCCSEDGKDFTCGQAGNKRAKSGLRLMETKEVPFYRLAVVEAAGKHQMVSQHPIFFHWLVDPVAEIHSWQMQGYRIFVIAMLATFAMSAAGLAHALKTMHLLS